MPAGSTLPLEMNRIHYDEVLLTGTFGFGPPDFRKAVELISSGKLDVLRLVTASVPLEATLEAMEELVHQHGVKTIVLCNRPAVTGAANK